VIEVDENAKGQAVEEEGAVFVDGNGIRNMDWHLA
jgi:hypothetical protein